jgi:BASS family bile acid:Na+ symporter
MLEQIINAVVKITLVEMMVTIGLGITLADLGATVRNWRLLGGAMAANYVAVPIATVVLLGLFRADPMVSVGFLILAVCPGAPFAPGLASLAKGNVTSAAGLMVVLAGSSAVAAPLLLGLLLPWVQGGSAGERVPIDARQIALGLFVMQLLPLFAGTIVRRVWPGLARRLQGPAVAGSQVLGLLAGGLVMAAHLELLARIGVTAYLGMLLLLLVSLGAGWIAGGSNGVTRRTLALTTSLRNVGVALAIAVGAFANTAAVTAVVAYFVVEVLGSLLVAWWWSTRPFPTSRPAVAAA